MKTQGAAIGRVAPWLAGWIAGSAAHLQLAQLPRTGLLWTSLAIALSAWAAIWRAPPRALRAWAIASCAGVLAFSVCGLRAQAFAQDALDAGIEGRDLVLEGVVATLPQQGPQGLRLRLDVDAARDLTGHLLKVPPRVLLSWWVDEGATPPRIVAGERWRLAARLKAPHGNMNPGGFDYELWLWEQGVQATGSVRTVPAAERLGGGWRHPVERWRQAVRDRIVRQLQDRPRAAGVVAALVTGEQGAIGRADWDVFRATGVAHLMAISGLHVTMFAWLASAVVARLWRRSPRLCLAVPVPFAAPIAGVALAAAYAVFSGWGVPSQRTVAMLGTVALLRLTGRRWPWPHTWALAGAVVVAADPWALMQAGFWLSFVAVGVLFATDPGAPSSPVDESPRHRAWLQRARGLLAEQAVVTWALAPLTLLLFQQVSVVGLLANLVAIPWVTLVVTPLALGGVLLPPLWHPAAWALDALSALLVPMAAWPGAVLSLPAPPLALALAAVAGSAWMVLRLPLALRLLGLALVLPALLWQPPRPAPGEFSLLAVDVGQGTAVVVRTATHALLYDAGPRYSEDSDAGDRVVLPLLRVLGERLDRLVLSHRDTDHTGGAASVLRAQPQADLSASLEPGHPLLALRAGPRCAAGLAWDWDGVRFEAIHPAPDADLQARPNALSCVLRVSSASGAAALLTGDIERAQEDALLAGPGPLHADVMLMPHHGSRSSSGDAFIAAVSPTLAIAQAGWRNRFGHPAADVLARYASQGVAVAASPACGALHWQSTAPSAWTCERDLRRRYWHHRAIVAAPAGPP